MLVDQAYCQLFLFPLGHHFLQSEITPSRLILGFKIVSQGGLGALEILVHQGEEERVCWVLPFFSAMMAKACHKMISSHIDDLKQDFHTLKLVCDTLNRSRSIDRFSLANHANSTGECEISIDSIENCVSPNFQV